MQEAYRRITKKLRAYPKLSRKYYYMLEEINFKLPPYPEDLGPAYYMSGNQDQITIYMIFNITNPQEVKLLLMTIIHELAHRIQAKQYPNIFDGEHGKLFKIVCVELGLDPKGESEGLGQRDSKKEFYIWSNEAIKNI